MPVIRQLDPHVADLIAAGEVVERPSSVVKELMENAIDAGATAVTVEIEHGGMTLIRVTDNGCGIPADQAATAFLRHATSKIATEYDLEAIGTLGFRGEALAAISSVSRIDLLTKPADAPLGSALHLEAGVVLEQEEAGCPDGTTMVVRDLFYNTPARLKFMKKDAAEGAAVFANVQRLALSHPEVSVKFIRDGRQELLTPGDGQLKSAVYAVLGRDLALGFTQVTSSGESMSVSGYVSLPACCRGSRSYQHFFVNGRYIKSRTMMAALEEAYKNQKMVGRFPGCVLHLTVKPNAVDVNVHPTKTEVKFQSEQQVFSAVYHAVLAALSGDSTRPKAVLSAPKAEDTVTPNQTSLSLNDATAVTPAPVEQTSWKPAPTYRPAPRGSYTAPAGKPRPADPVKPAWPSPFQRVTPLPQKPAQERPASAPAEKPVENSVSLPAEPVRPVAPAETSAKAPEPQTVREPDAVPAPEPVPAAPVPAEPAPAIQPESAAPAEAARPEPQPEAEPWLIRGELFHTYVMVEQGDKIILIDKHAAHERANFDRLKAADYQPMVQELLAPVTFTPAPEEREVLLEQTSLLARFGFDVEEFGSAALAVRSVPDYLDTGDIEDALLELARCIRETGAADPAAARDELMHTMACKAAIKGGQKNGPEELMEVARLVMSGAVKYCPHGRPVAIELTKYQLEKQFKRA